MAVKSRWSTIEGGIANTFPLSINRNAHWTALRRGECYAQDMADWERRGVLRYVPAPTGSSQCVTKRFSEFLFNEQTYIVEFYAYGRYWKVNLKDQRELLFSEIYLGGDIIYDQDAAILFADDGNDPIQLVAPDGNGRIFVLKANYHAAITLTEHGSSYLLRLHKDVSFLNKALLRQYLERVADDSDLLIDGQRARFIDHDILETIVDFMQGAEERNIRVELQGLTIGEITPLSAH